MPWPSITATQLVVENSSSPSRNTRPLARHSSILRGEPVRDRHRPALIPELGIVALGRIVVEDDEVADVLERPCICRLYSSRSTGLKRLSGNRREQLGDAALDEVDAGRFERLDEAARQGPARRHCVPGELAPARCVKDESPRLGQRLAFEIGEQHSLAPRRPT